MLFLPSVNSILVIRIGVKLFKMAWIGGGFAVYANTWFDRGDASDELLKALHFELEGRKDIKFPVTGLVRI